MNTEFKLPKKDAEKYLSMLLEAVEKAVDASTDIGVYPLAVKGYNDERDYEQRDGYKNGWNAAVQEIVSSMYGVLEGALSKLPQEELKEYLKSKSASHD